MKIKRSRKAFTIVELVIVIAVIAVLASVLVPTFGDVISNAKDSAAKYEARNAYTDYMAKNAANGEMPELFLYLAAEGRVVALQNGAAVGVYESEDAALTALGLEEDAKLTNTGDGKLFAYGGEVPEAGESGKPISFAGKKISILGDSISTFEGVSNSTAFNSTLGSNIAHYPDMYNLTRADTWWQQVIDSLGMNLCVNNSWAGSWILSHTASGGYGNRCVNLHNDQTGEEPDVIVVYMGTNDFGNGKATFGKAGDIDYQTLIIAKDDGTYDYATPTTSCEAYAIMLHKIQQRYPDAEIFCMTLLPDRNPDHPTDGRGYGSPAPYNAELRKIISYFDCALVDLEYCIDRTGEVFDQYFADHRIHPNEKGMDAISDALISVMQGNTASMDDMNANATVFLNGNDGGLIQYTSDYTYVLVSNYIEIPEGSIISKFCSITHMDGTKAYCAFYDANKNFISAYKPATDDGTVIGNWKYTEIPPEIPAGAKYIRVAFNDGLEDYNGSLDVVKREYALLEFAYDIQCLAIPKQK